MIRRRTGHSRSIPASRLLLALALLAGFIAPMPRNALAAPAKYPDLRPTSPSALYFDRITIDGRLQYILRFSNTVWNVGEGRFEIQGNPNPNGSNAIYQNIYDSTSGGSQVIHRQLGLDLIYHPTHFHFHLSNLASYQLLQRNSAGSYQPAGAEGTKTSFCIIDYARLSGGGPAAARYTACGSTLQGISVGWGDTYVASLPEQWVVIGPSRLADGFYAIQSTVDPLNKIDEGGRDGNNVATTYFNVRNGTITIGTATSAEPTGTTGKVVNTGGSNLNCRATPNGSVLTTLPPGAIVSVTGAPQNGWYPVTCGGRDGWVSATYLQVSGTPSGTPTPEPTGTPSGLIGTVFNTNGLNLNCRATPNGTIIAKIPAGTSVQVRGSVSNGWYPVVCGGSNGWVAADYLMVEDGTVTIPPNGLTGTVVNTGGAGLRCRMTPGGAIITTLPAGSTVPVTGTTQRGWVPVTCANRAGWASADYMRIDGYESQTPTPPPPVTETPQATTPPTAPSLPTQAPTQAPTEMPTLAPTEVATQIPPTAAPTQVPTQAPTQVPTQIPPTAAPTEEPPAP